MSFLNQPPLGAPGFGNSNGLYGPSTAQTKNPFYSVGNQFLPRNLHDVIKWVRFITVNSPVTTEVIRKLSTYPITEFVYDCKDTSVKNKYKQISNSFKLKATLHDVGFQYHTLGNVFVSIHFPIHRSYACTSQNCGYVAAAEKASFLKFRNFKMMGTCPKCQSNLGWERRDSKSMNIDDMNIILWDPVNISVNHNPITGKNQYFYSIPNDIKRRVQMGDRFLVDSMPWEFIEAIENNKDFQFQPDRIFHLKNIDMGMSLDGIAVPPLVSHFSLVFYQATLRRANESISTDFMAPMRVIFPQAQSANSDPTVALSMRNFTNRMEEAFMKHKHDNNHVLIAPVPIGYQAISGEGKTLLVSQEIQQAEDSLFLSMGVSRELLSGTTNWTSSTVGLRMLKNTLDSYVGQISELIKWIFTHSSNYLGLPVHDVYLTPFQLTDDEMLKTLITSLAQNGAVSMGTVFESMGKSYEEELEKILQETKIKARHDVRVKFEMEQAQYLEGLEINKENEKNNGYMDILRVSQELASQLINADETVTREVLNELKVTDYAKYLMVSKLVEEGRAGQTAQMNQELAAQATDPNSPNAPKGPPGASGGPGEAGGGVGSPTDSNPLAGASGG